MFEKLIEAAVEKALDRRTVRPDKKLTVEGYHPLPEIMGCLYEWVFVPFRGAQILVEVRYPRLSQLPQVDKLYNVIERQKKAKETKLTRQEMIDVMNIQEDCCKAVLNRPTFEELELAIYSKDRVLEERKKRLEEMCEKLKLVNGREKQELQMEIDRLELFIGYILPDDTTVALTDIALGMDISDIRKMTKEKLLAAYTKARLYNQKPSDFIPGIFTDGDRENIDNYATVLGSEEEIRRSKEKGRKS
jgi:hypothetical protein